MRHAPVVIGRAIIPPNGASFAKITLRLIDLGARRAQSGFVIVRLRRPNSAAGMHQAVDKCLPLVVRKMRVGCAP